MFVTWSAVWMAFLRKRLASILAAAIVSAIVSAPRPARADVGGGNFGLGLVLGEPTGISAQLDLGGPGQGTALNFALGLDLIDHGDFYGHVDYVWLFAELVRGSSVSIPAYVGVGAFVRDRKNGNAGARVPFGIQLEFRRTQIHIFAEITLRLTLVDGSNLDARGAAGFRYFF